MSHLEQLKETINSIVQERETFYDKYHRTDDKIIDVMTDADREKWFELDHLLNTTQARIMGYQMKGIN